MMERYDTRGYKCGGPSNNDCMEKDPEGDYVLYSDAEAIERVRDDLLKENKDLNDTVDAYAIICRGHSGTLSGIYNLRKRAEKAESARAAAQGEVERMREVIETMIQFIPDGWEMPLGWNQVVAQAQEAIGGKP